MELEFETVEELYKRLLPALKSKKRELHKLGYSYINEEEIWDFLKRFKWSKSHDLTLSDMVGDIINIDNLVLDQFLKEKMIKEKRKNDLEIL